MAVTGDVYNSTENLILAKPRRHFRAGVRWHHWQLRSLLGTDGQNVVYFPVGTDQRNVHVQRLNTKTRETESVKKLSFMPRCLVARKGWVCCGGELGQFSAFRVGEEAGRGSDLQPDDRLPLSLDLPEAISSSLAEALSDKNMVVRSNVFGKDRVNCITLWFPPMLGEACEGAYDQDVAVLANNDSSVVVVSLRDQETLDKIQYPDYMNRGVISPDGRVLIAISDDPYLYIHERREKKGESGISFRVADRPLYEWAPCGRIQLKSQSKDDRSDSRGSFAACFSSTGRYLAVGTQYGTISIFDTAALIIPGVDPLLMTFTTSRPNAEHGAVRDMAFSPGPTDLLAWTEDRGRVGIADIRTGFDSRQILYLDRDDDFEHVDVTDRNTIDPRLLERHDRAEALLSNLADTLETRHAGQSEGQESPGRYNVPLSPEETAVLEAIQDFRRRQDQYNNSGSTRIGRESSSNNNGNGGSGTGTSTRSPWAERATRSALTPDSARPRERTASVNQAVNEILDNIRDQRERIRDSQERMRARGEDYITTERRRYAGNPFSGRASGLGITGSGSSERRAVISRLMSNTNPASTGGWDNVEALYDDPSPDSGDPPPDPPDETQHPLFHFRSFADAQRRLHRAAYLMREWDENPSRRIFGTYTPHIRPGPYDTAGLSWSENGDVLFVGAENGIYEFRVNLFERKLSPSITLS